MRIIGGKDYYDSAVAYGIDPGVVFVRNSQSLTNGQMEKIGAPVGNYVKIYTRKEYFSSKPKWAKKSMAIGSSSEMSSATLDGTRYYFENMPVIFCGKAYAGLRIAESSYSRASNETFIWTLDKLVKWCDDRDLYYDFEIPYWESKRSNSTPFSPCSLREDTVQTLIDLRLSIVTKQSNGFYPGYSKKDRIDWLERESGWYGNCDGLGDINFQSVVDPYTAFQELSMWVGGTLSSSNGPNTVTITDDKVKIAKHGFDQSSFRKPKA